MGGQDLAVGRDQPSLLELVRQKQQVDAPARLANVTASGGTRLWLNADDSWEKE